MEVEKCIVIFTLVYITLSKVRNSSSTRVKRVHYGKIVAGRNTGYDAVRYYGFIGTHHGVPRYSTKPEANTDGQLHCSGALITPSVVQTACHCLSKFENTINGYFIPPTVELHWESLRVVYIGVNNRFGEGYSMETVNPLVSRKFIVHRKCGEPDKEKTSAVANTHDYGWITIGTVITWTAGHLGVPTVGVDFAPQYSEKHLAEIWEYNIKRQAICLTIGFGNYDPENYVASDFLLHGWSGIIGQRQCKQLTTKGIPTKNISQYMTWFCVEPFPSQSGLPGPGDSGGPISCNNYHFAVGSGVHTTSVNNLTAIRAMHGGIAFAVFENAAEFRRNFISFLNDYEKSSFVELVEFKYPNKDQTFKPKPLDLRHSRDSISGSPGWPFLIPPMSFVVSSLLYLVIA